MTEAKLPARAPPDLVRRIPTWALRRRHEVLWAVLDTVGAYVRPFGQMRSWGPLPSGRFDPHPDGPPGDTSGELVSYAATSLVTAVAERYRDRRAVTPHDHNQPAAYAWLPRRDLRLIDVTGPGAVRLGASHKINSGPKNVTRRWARALRSAWPDADGLLYASSMTGEQAVTLWAPAQSTFGPAPAFASLIASPAPIWRATLRDACSELGYDWVL